MRRAEFMERVRRGAEKRPDYAVLCIDCDRLHLINLLKRRPECGNPCHLCERSCPVRAIEKTGRIVTAECFQCLDCQVEYYDDKRCPPLVQAAKLRRDLRPAAAVVAAEKA